MDEPLSAKRVIASGYDRLGPAFSAWQAQNPIEVTSWFLGEVLVRLGERSSVLELGCGPGTAAAELAAGRRYVGVDLSGVQLSIARERVPSASFARADFTTMLFRPASFDGVVAFYAFNHVPQEELASTFAQIFAWLRPGGRLMASLGANATENAIEQDWLGVPMFFAGFKPETNERLLRDAGFHLELSDVREAVTKDGEVERFHWVIARRPASGLLPERSYPPLSMHTSLFRKSGPKTSGLGSSSSEMLQ